MKQSYFENVPMPKDPFRIKAFLTSSFEHALTVHPHWHSEIELLLILKGYAVQQVNGQLFTVETGDIVMIGKNQLHSTYSYLGSNCEILVVMFDKSDLVESWQAEAGPQPPVFEKSMIFDNPIKSGSFPGERLSACMLGIYRELEGREPGYPFAVKALLYEIFALAVRGKRYSVAGRGGDFHFTKSVLENTFRLIDEKFSEEISLQKAASASNLSVPHFCRLFKKTTGMTFNAYLNFFRVNQAEIMLKTQKPITAVAFDCGFKSLSTFLRNFKKYKNCTPNVWKRV